MNYIWILNCKLFPIFIFLHIINKINSILSFDYPHSITLSNGNIFLIHQEGIDIYDSSFNKINQIIRFSDEEEITKEIFAKIELKYDNEYILSIINDKIYIFDNKGEFLYKSNEKVNNNQTIQNYALTPIGLYNDSYNYTIAFFDNKNYLNLQLYSYNIKNNNNNLINARKDYSYMVSGNSDFEVFSRNKKGLSCEYMSYYSYYDYEFVDEILVCFFSKFSSSCFGTTYYKISNNQINFYSNKISVEPDMKCIDDDDNNHTFIKSEINFNRTLALVWYNDGEYRTSFFTFNITLNKFSKNNFIKCSNVSYETNIFKNNNVKEITFACAKNDNNEKVEINLYKNETYNITSKFNASISCENTIGPQIFYYNNSQNKNNYYIYSCFKNCSDEFYMNDSYCININEKQRTNSFVIYIILSVVILIALVILVWVLYLRKGKDTQSRDNSEKSKNDDKLMDDIKPDLLPNNS